MIIYLRDLYDHIVQAIENIEIYRDMITGMLDIYLSSINNGMNKIMQFLTILGTIFLPLTFITGIYGMNFENMPELKWHWAYYFVLCVMTAIAGSMLFFFKKKKWL
jgi:magnesium transporter